MTTSDDEGADGGEQESLKLIGGVTSEPPPRREGEGILSAMLRQDNPGYEGTHPE